jgi:hypothetical protein
MSKKLTGSLVTKIAIMLFLILNLVFLILNLNSLDYFETRLDATVEACQVVEVEPVIRPLILEPEFDS